ncbi:MAG: alpha/beta hydrolase [Pseudomonadota bacterium]
MNRINLFVASCFFSSQVFAADFITLIYGPIKRSIPVSEFHYLEETGKGIGSLGELLRLAKQPPARVQELLKTSFDLDVVDASNFLNSSLANGILTKLGRAIHPPYSSDYSVQAFRAAFIASAADGNIKVIEIFDNYPNRQMWIDLEVLPEVIKELGSILNLRGFGK